MVVVHFGLHKSRNEVRSVIFVKIVSESVTHYNNMNELEVFCYQF